MIVTSLSSEPLDQEALIEKIRTPECGALVSFEGSTRSPSDGKIVTELSYEAYEARAEKQLRELAERAVSRWSLGGAVAVHRTGNVPPGEPSVFVACAAAHRAEAFEAARWLIDTIKAEVAIWKREVTEDGAAWVGIDVKENR